MKDNNEREKWDKKARTLLKIGITLFLVSLLMAGWYVFTGMFLTSFETSADSGRYYLVRDNKHIAEISPGLYHQLGFIFWWFPKIIIGLFILGSLFGGSLAPAAGERYLGKEKWSEIRSKIWENPFRAWIRAVTPRFSELKPYLIYVAVVISLIFTIFYPIFFIGPAPAGQYSYGRLCAQVRRYSRG